VQPFGTGNAADNLGFALQIAEENCQQDIAFSVAVAFYRDGLPF